MDVPYHWYSPTAPVPAYYPSPAPSGDPSPAPRPHQQLQEQYIQQPVLDQIESNVGPARALSLRRKARNLTEHADRYSDAVYLQTPSYRPGTPSSMASPYSPYEYGHRPRSRSFSYPDDTLRIPSPTPSAGSAKTSLSTGTTHHHRSDGQQRTVQKPKHTKNRLRDVDRKNICLYHIEFKNARQEDIGAHFGVERSTISKVLKEKDKWLKISPEAEANDQSTKHRPSKFPEIEEVMMESLQHWSDTGTNITDQLIRSKALEIARTYHITPERFKGSSGWVENYKHRHEIRRGEWLRARRHPTSTIPFKPPRIIPSTPVIKPYDQQLKPSDFVTIPYPGLTPIQPPPQTTTQKQILVQSWSPTHTQGQQVVQEQQTSLVLDPALRDGPAVTHAAETTQHPPHHGAYETNFGVIYDPGVISVSNPAAPNPTFQEAENALKLVISFLDTEGREIIKDNDRDALNHIRSAMNEWSNRMSYNQTA